MIDKIHNQFNTIVANTSLVLFLVYFVGFVSTSVYLHFIAGSAIELLNFQYLITGLLCITMFLPPIITLLFNYQKRTDNANKTIHMMPFIFFRTFFTGYVTVIILTFPSMKYNNSNKVQLIIYIIVYFLSFLYSVFIDFYLTSYAARNISKNKKSLLYLTSLMIQVILVFTLCNSVIKIYAILMYFIIIFVYVYLGLIADNKTDLRALSLTPIVLLIFICILSFTILPHISSSIGGFKFRNMTFIVRDTYLEQVKKLDLDVDSTNCLQNQNVAYLSDSYVIVRNNNNYIRLNKELFIGNITNTQDIDDISKVIDVLF